MNPKSKRDEWLRNFSRQIPGSFDFSEGQKCYDAGFSEAVRLADEILVLEAIRGLLFKYHDKEIVERISKLIVILKIIDEMSKEHI